jgi:hypothetical protein
VNIEEIILVMWLHSSIWGDLGGTAPDSLRAQ